MEFISKILAPDPDFSSLINDINKERFPLACTGLSLIHKGTVLSAVHSLTKRKIAVITHDEASCHELAADAESLGLKTLVFPLRDYCIGNLSGYSKEYEHKRTDTLSALADGAFDLLCFSVDAAIQYTVPPKILKEAEFSLKVGQIIEIPTLTQKLLSAGYVRSELCEGGGQFSQRGGIFDIYPINSESPCRIEFWGDEIDTISYFDSGTQRRTDSTEEIEISPACEVLYDSEDLCEKLANYLQKNKKLTPEQIKRIEEDISALENGISILPDRYLPIIYPEGETIFNYLEDCLLFVSETGNILERFKSMEIQQSADIEGYLEDGFLSADTAKLWLSKNEFYSHINRAIILENFPRTTYE